jgi:hypothetical protein
MVAPPVHATDDGIRRLLQAYSEHLYKSKENTIYILILSQDGFATRHFFKKMYEMYEGSIEVKA